MYKFHNFETFTLINHFLVLWGKRRTTLRLRWLYEVSFTDFHISETTGSVLSHLKNCPRPFTLIGLNNACLNEWSSRLHPNHGSHKGLWQLSLLSGCLLVAPAAEPIVPKLVNPRAAWRYPFLHKGLVKEIWEGFKGIIFVHTWRPLPDAPDCHMP